MSDGRFDPGAEFDRQFRTLLDMGYPAIAGLTEDAFTRLVAPLRRAAVTRGASMLPPTEGRVPFVLVITKELVPADRSMPLTALAGKARPGVVDRNYASAEDVGRFEAVKELEIPEGTAYLLLDVDRGEETLNLPPEEAMPIITGQDRTPLTIDEGISLITHYPAALAKNKCFSLAGSRCGDRRVPALWISQGAPKLGWCWAGNPHTWLGTASCAGRAGPD
jgi:hypothetical protein